MASGRLDASPTAFIASCRGRLASKWRSWAVTPRIYCAVTARNSSHNHYRYRKLPHHVAHYRTRSEGTLM